MAEYKFCIPNTVVYNIAACAGARGATHPLQLPSKQTMAPIPISLDKQGKSLIRARHLSIGFSLARTIGVGPNLQSKANKKDYGG
jgi:hypothetical protein